MARVDIGGIGIAYDVVGTGERTAAITPGGRFSIDTPGIRPLAERIAAAGYRVLIWDRPNCGASDVCFDGETESIQNADTLAGLLRVLGCGPTLLISGSGGARDTLLTAIRHPGVASRLFLLWISGGAIGCTGVAYFYTHDAASPPRPGAWRRSPRCPAGASRSSAIPRIARASWRRTPPRSLRPCSAGRPPSCHAKARRCRA